VTTRHGAQATFQARCLTLSPTPVYTDIPKIITRLFIDNSCTPLSIYWASLVDHPYQRHATVSMADYYSYLQYKRDQRHLLYWMIHAYNSIIKSSPSAASDCTLSRLIVKVFPKLLTLLVPSNKYYRSNYNLFICTCHKTYCKTC
jgi:hypothetical protein